ncbi:acireductone synthase [Hydrogenobacter thermophilus]|uniref:acireductone synthase n=1 Tax=Hydrogenobacter thermophilus TaxID=940 RepID=UPI003CCFF5C9
MISAILTDIEGTTSSISFVKDVLFPYSRRKLRDFLRDHTQDREVQAILEELFKKVGKRLSIEETAELLTQWIDQDKKEPILKDLQGLIWEEGYRKGELIGHIYQDAYQKLKEWHQKGIKLYVFSSGSVKAQRLLFSHTPYGDITYLFSGYFDAKIGSKKSSESYLKIAKAVSLKPEQMLFLSDVEEELNAAKSAGMHTIRLVRDGEAFSKHTIVKDFYSITI